VGGLAVDAQRLPGDRLDACHDADVDAGVGEDRALLDMAFDVRAREGRRWCASPFQPVRTIWNGDGETVIVGERVGVLEAGCGRR
jgi:hypothetical protein